MAEVVYVLCAVTSIACAVMLFRAWRASRTGLLAWSTAAFAVFALNNIFLFLDLIVIVDVDLSFVRTLTALVAVTVLLVGLITESR
jgi:hypothetical protein